MSASGGPLVPAGITCRNERAHRSVLQCDGYPSRVRVGTAFHANELAWPDLAKVIELIGTRLDPSETNTSFKGGITKTRTALAQLPQQNASTSGAKMPGAVVRQFAECDLLILNGSDIAI